MDTDQTDEPAAVGCNTDGTTARQLGVEWLDGKLMSYYVFDVGKAQQQNLKGRAGCRQQDCDSYLSLGCRL
jgi:hypothetical protein